MPFIRFSSHRARSYGLRALDRHPQAYFSFHRKTGPGGVYEVTAEEIARLGDQAVHVRGTGHEWTRDEAREAGRKSGVVRRQRLVLPSPSTTLNGVR